MRSESFYDNLKEINQYIYEHPNKDFKQWKLLDVYSDNTGVFIELFDIGNNEVLFVVKGTDPITGLHNDGRADAALFNKKIPAQYGAAEKYLKSLEYENIILTGYSLGGSIVQMLGANYGNESITIEAFGAGDILNKQVKNVLNFGNLYDNIFMDNYDKHLGQIKIMPVKAKEGTSPNINWHFLWNCGNPSEATNPPADVKIPINIYKNGMKATASDKVNTAKKYVKAGMLQAEKELNDVSQKAKEQTKRVIKKLRK